MKTTLRVRLSRRPLIAVALLVSILAVGVGLTFWALQEFADPKRSTWADMTATRLRGAIRDEIKTIGNRAWAGEYYWGNGLGANVSLMLAPENGCLYELHGCLGLYDRNYGSVASKQGTLHLSFALPNRDEGVQGIAEEFVPISWGDRQYLIPADDVVGFCNEVNGGSEPRASAYGSCLLRRGDELKEVIGFPTVPPQFRAYLLSVPIEATIVEVGNATLRPSVCEWNSRETVVTLDVGKEDGVLPGMKLHVIEPDDIIESVQVSKVGKERSEAVMTQIDEDDAPPREGWNLSTRSRWNRN